MMFYISIYNHTFYQLIEKMVGLRDIMVCHNTGMYSLLRNCNINPFYYSQTTSE